METKEQHSARNKAYYYANKAKILAHKAAHYDQINATRRKRLGMKTKAEYLASLPPRKPPRHYINKRLIYGAVRNAIVHHSKPREPCNDRRTPKLGEYTQSGPL